MHSTGDVLGDEGRKALDACVKVKIYGRPQNIAKYYWRKAWRRLEECFSGYPPDMFDRGWKKTLEFQDLYPPGLSLGKWGWLQFEHLQCRILPTELHVGHDGYGHPKDRICDIIEILDALKNLDEIVYVEKYPKPGPRSDELKKLIDRRRSDIEREYQEAILGLHGIRLHVTDVMSSSPCWLTSTKNFSLDSFVSSTDMETTKVLFETLGIACKLSMADPDKQCRYSWLVAQRRVRDCYAGSFAGDRAFLDDKCYPSELYSIIEIHDAVVQYDEKRWFGEYCDQVDDSSTRQIFDVPRDNIIREFEETSFNLDGIVKEYLQDEAEKRVRECFEFIPGHAPFDSDVFPIKRDESGVITQTYNIFDIHKALQHFDEKTFIQKYPENEGPGSEELKKSIEKHNSEMKKEYQEAKCRLHRYSQGDAEKRLKGCFFDYLQGEEEIFFIKEGEIGETNIKTYDIVDIYNNMLHHSDKSKKEKHQYCQTVEENRAAVTKEYQKARNKLGKYSRSEAERRARDCFAGTFLQDTDIFCNKEEEKCGIPKMHQTYDIFDIKNAIDHFDAKKLFDKYLDEKYLYSKSRNQFVDDERKKIEEEYAKATAKFEIEHGSGFIVHDHFIITNKHVIEDAENDKTKAICVSNAAIHGELVCEVAYTDAGKDLALLYCPELNLKENGISPLQLSNQPLLPGMQVFSFGYPMSHTGEAGLFVNGHVSGSKKTYSGHTMIVLNCALNSGNSGGPVLCFIGGQLKVVGVATQKHFKEILTLDERETIEKIRESLQTSSICSISDDVIKYAAYRRSFSEGKLFPDPDPCHTPMNLLTLKLYDALETHSQFNLSNALPGHCVVEFIQETISKYKGQCKEELLEIVKWSEDHANVLPSGHHSASNCCVQ